MTKVSMAQQNQLCKNGYNFEETIFYCANTTASIDERHCCNGSSFLASPAYVCNCVSTNYIFKYQKLSKN